MNNAKEHPVAAANKVIETNSLNRSVRKCRRRNNYKICKKKISVSFSYRMEDFDIFISIRCHLFKTILQINILKGYFNRLVLGFRKVETGSI